MDTHRTSSLVVGSSGTATLGIENSGKVSAANGVKVGDVAGSSGVINLTSGGRLETLNLDGTGVGAKQLNFDNGVLRANAGNASFITGFAGTELNIAGGGLTVDTQSFNVTAASPFSGVGGLTKTGTGTLTLTGANTYTDQTGIQSGTLALSGNGSIASSSRVVADGTFDISAVTPTSASIQSLAGGGTVNLGDKQLILTNANDTFAGTITGTGGGLTVSAGTETLTGISNYTGATNVTGTGTLQLLNGGRITGTSTTLMNGPGATMTVGGAGSLLQTGSLTLGNTTGSDTTLNVLNGGEVQTGGARIGGLNAQTATVNVDGAGSLLDAAGILFIGADTLTTNAFLKVTNGGAVWSSGANIGGLGTAIGTKSALISGPDSSWAVTNNLNILGGASMAVLDGGAVTAGASIIGSGGTSTLLVSGAGSSYAVADDLTVGGFTGSGTGIVTLADGARMSVGGTLTLANSMTRSGVLNIGGAEGQAATGAGTLDAATLAFGPGTGRVNFNHTDAAYMFSTAMSGGGAVNQTGPGTTILTGDNTYTGSHDDQRRHPAGWRWRHHRHARQRQCRQHRRAGLQPVGRHKLWRHHQRHRRPGEARQQHTDAHRQQYLWRPDHDCGRHPAGWRWRHHRHARRRRCRQQRHAGLQPV